MSAYTPTGTIAFLQNYNSWRRGDETLEMPHPAEIGANIQEAIVLLRKYDSLLTEGDQLRAEIELDEQLQAATEASLKTLTAERDQLRAIFPQICAAIGNGAFCTPTVSVGFIQSIPTKYSWLSQNSAHAPNAPRPRLPPRRRSAKMCG